MNIVRLAHSLRHSSSLISLWSGLMLMMLGLSQSVAAGRIDHAKVISVQPIYMSNRYQQECWPEHSRYDSHRGNIAIINGAIGGTGYSLQINPHPSRSHYDSDRYGNRNNYNDYNSHNNYNKHNNHYSNHHNYQHDDRFKFNKHGHQPPHHYNRGHRDCAPRYGTHHRQKLVGYDVIYKYYGRTYRTRTHHHPGKHLRVSEHGLPI